MSVTPQSCALSRLHRGCVGRRGLVSGAQEAVAIAVGGSDKAFHRAEAPESKGREFSGSKIWSLAAGWIGGWRAGRSWG